VPAPYRLLRALRVRHNRWRENNTIINGGKMSMSKKTKVLIGFICLTLAGCMTTKKDWEFATQQNTIDSYEQFLSSHPDADETSIAKQKVSELRQETDWQVATTHNTINSYKNYLKHHSDSKHSGQRGQSA
jgi:uncharacterized membrane protein YvbJ